MKTTQKIETSVTYLQLIFKWRVDLNEVVGFVTGFFFQILLTNFIFISMKNSADGI